MATIVDADLGGDRERERERKEDDTPAPAAAAPTGPYPTIRARLAALKGTFRR